MTLVAGSNNGGATQDGIALVVVVARQVVVGADADIVISQNPVRGPQFQIIEERTLTNQVLDELLIGDSPAHRGRREETNPAIRRKFPGSIPAEGAFEVVAVGVVVGSPTHVANPGNLVVSVIKIDHVGEVDQR